VYISTHLLSLYLYFFFFQAEDGIRDATVTGVQTCALPISNPKAPFVTRVVQFGSEPLFDNVLSHQDLAAQVQQAKSALSNLQIRSEERRVGKECRCRWSAEH